MGLKSLGPFDNITKSKIHRLLIPYFVWGLIYVLPVKRFSNFYTDESLIQAIRGFLSGQESSHLWFLPALFWCILVFCVILKIFARFKVNSIYAVLLVAGIIQLTYTYIPFDVLGFKTGLGYLFYFAIGYAFEKEIRIREKWNLKKVIVATLIFIAIEVINCKYAVLDNFFTILAGACFTFMFSDILDRAFKNVSENKAWQFLVRNLFYVYIFHDPLDYVVLRFAFSKDWLMTTGGCYAYLISRTLMIFIISLLLGELVGRAKLIM